jgi:hypothetical protein
MHKREGENLSFLNGNLTSCHILKNKNIKLEKFTTAKFIKNLKRPHHY